MGGMAGDQVIHMSSGVLFGDTWILDGGRISISARESWGYICHHISGFPWQYFDGRLHLLQTYPATCATCLQGWSNPLLQYRQYGKWWPQGGKLEILHLYRSRFLGSMDAFTGDLQLVSHKNTRLSRDHADGLTLEASTLESCGGWLQHSDWTLLELATGSQNSPFPLPFVSALAPVLLGCQFLLMRCTFWVIGDRSP